VVALAAAATSGRAQTPDEKREQSEQARERAAEISGQIHDHAAEAEEIESVIRALAADIDANRAARDAASRSLESARRAADAAEASIADLQEDRRRTVESLRRAAVNAFVEFQGSSGSVDFIEDPWGSTWLETLAEIGTGTGREELDRFRSIDAQLDLQRRIAEEAAAEAEQLQAELDSEKQRLDSALAIQEELRDEVDHLIDDLLVEAAALEELAAQLDDEAAREEAAKKRAEQQRLGETLNSLVGDDSDSDDDPAAGTGSDDSGSGDGSDDSSAGDNDNGDAGGNDNGNNAGGNGDSGSGGDSDDEHSCAGKGFDIETEFVAGIEVAATITEDVEGLLAALAAEGFAQIGGGGFRSCERQVELRRKHCGTSQEAIWEWPARRCRPPTARPGQSNHQKALAIDFTYQGRLVRSRSSEIFRALARLAPDYNFANLPSEPWHWDHASAR